MADPVSWAAAAVANAIIAVAGSSAAAVAVASAVGTAVLNVGLALTFSAGLTAGLSAWATVASIGAVARGRPKVGGDVGTQVDFKADPRAGIPYAMGETGVGGNVVFATTAETKNAHLLYLTVLSGCGPIDGITGFYGNDELLTFAADNAVNARFHNKMWERRQTGSNVPATFFPPSTTLGSFTDWTSAHKLTGYTAQWWVLEYDQKAYATGTPKPLTVGRWVWAYDPRLDSTYPGGSGPQRSTDETTWAYSDNPFAHALTFCLGRYQNGKRILGLGALLAMIDVASFVEGMNVCDANAWKIGGVIYSTDDKYQCLSAMLQAGGGWPTTLGAKISCGVNAPKVSIATLTGEDQADGAVTISAARTKRDKFNGVIPSYRSSAHRYDVVPASKISVATYLTEDGVDLTCEPEFILCPDVDQAAQLGRYVVSNSREFGPISIPAKPRWWGYKANDCITVNEPEWGLVNAKCVIVERLRDPSTGVVNLSLITETDAKHAAALGQTGTAPPSPSLTTFDATTIAAPGAGAFTLAGATLTSTAGSVPALVVTGAVDDVHAVEILLRYRVNAGPGAWVDGGNYPAASTRIEITGVSPGTVYGVEVAYRSPRGVPSAWTSLGTATAGAMTVTIYDAALSDGILTPAEKSTSVVPHINALIAARTALRTQATALGLTTGTSTARADFETAATNLDSYLATLTSPVAWNNTAGNTTISAPSTWRTRIEDATKTTIDLQTAIDTAQKTLVDKALSDGVLTISEKRDIVPIFNALIANRTNLRTQATALGLTTGTSTPRANYETAATNLDSYLATLTSPVAWNAFTDTTTISAPSTFRTRLEDAQKTERELQTAIAEVYKGRTQLIDSNGRLTTIVALPGINVPIGFGFTFTSFPFTSDSTHIYVAATTLKAEGFSRSLPATTCSGLTASTRYGMVFQWVGNFWGPIDPLSEDIYIASVDQWLFAGEFATTDAGGTVYPAPIEPAGFVGTRAGHFNTNQP